MATDGSYNRLKSALKENKKDIDLLYAPLDVYLNAISIEEGKLNYHKSLKELTTLISDWFLQNSQNFKYLLDKEASRGLKLPFIDYDACPREKFHSGFITDGAGRLRCTHKSEEIFKPSFIDQKYYFDHMAEVISQKITENKPFDPSLGYGRHDDTYELIKVSKKQKEQDEIRWKKFKQQESSLIVTDFCYAIVSDKNTILPLETILRRLNKHPLMEFEYWNKKDRIQVYKEIEFPFDAQQLEAYVILWYQQLPVSCGFPPIFEKEDPLVKRLRLR